MLLCAAFLSTCQVVRSETASSITQFGASWTFDKDHEVGHFVNGDWWVLGPVTIIGIQPASDGEINGTMMNPSMNAGQGFDHRIKSVKFNPELNVAAKLPLTVSEPASLVSAISIKEKTTGDNIQLDTIAILTVLNTAPPEGSFRPPYQGADKTIIANKADLNFAPLGKYETVSAAPDFSVAAAAFERPWIELQTNWTGRYLHPVNNQPSYGREIAHVLGNGLLALQLDAPDSAKETLLIRMVQIGIDIFGAARMGATWGADGGHNQGRKMPLLLAAVVLENNEMLKYADAQQHFIFQEDQQTFSITQEDVDLARTPGRDGKTLEPYNSKMIGQPEWGIRHSTKPGSDNANWDATYRTVSGAPTLTHVLVARLMKLEDKWNHPVIFEYYDRHWEIEKDRTGAGPNGVQQFTKQMWEAHRARP